MPWLQVKIEIKPQLADQFEDLLLAAGALSVTYQDSQDQPIYEPELGTTPLWNNTVITGLFDAEQNMQQMEQHLRHTYLQLASTEPFPSLHTEILEDKDWEREWMKSYKPMQFGQRLWVCPSWCDAPDPNAINLMLDPGLAFGTGTHPTTELCLRWLDSIDCQDKTVTDYGCGSGILGVAALLLGATSVLAVDIDLQALQATKTNLQRNGLPESQLSTYLPEQAPAHKSDILVANILSGPLVELAPTLAQRVNSNGLLALSGLLANQLQEIIDAYSSCFTLQPAVELDGWIRVTGIRK
ncbi:MAG: 50S ribosomal protein L11 methyltransferase [Pseudomonadales bacterium]|nr:50S ribosomal protein L11 methyltransferase [Pseudomonadales bacterium]NRA16277.1 50S ribosomal protein L11 methyltransferase [Oceanospirillaceae bacterium]